MPQSLMTRARGAGTTLAGFSPAQKLLAVIGIAVLALGGSAFYRWAATPTYAPLFSNLAPADASAIVDQLASAGVQYELEDGGTTVMVPREAVNAQRLAAASQGLPGNSDTGYALLDAEGVTSSQFQQQITYQRAMEGELATTIEGIDGVNTAVVHLAIPEETVFTDEAGTATASVLVDTAPGTSLSDDQVQSVVHLVSSSVPDLAVDQVTVSSSDGTLLSAAGSGLTGGVGGRDGQTTEYEKRTEAAVQAMLDRVVGVGNAVATVTAELDFDQTQRTREEFTSEPDVEALSESTQTETYTGGAPGVGGALGDNGVLGMDGQEVAAGTGAAGDGGYTKSSTTRNNAVNKVTEQTTAAPGSVRRQSVAVVVDTTAAAGAGVPQLTQVVTAAAGIDAARGDTLVVSQLPFDTTSADAAAEELAAAEEAAAVEQRNALIKAGGIGLLVLVVLVALFLVWRSSAKKRARQVVDLGQIDAMYRRDDVITQDGAALGTALSGPQLGAAGAPTAAARRLEVGELVDQQPTEVASVLRGWLGERSR